jgi:hypothetical protein
MAKTGRLIHYDTEGRIAEVWESLDAQRKPTPRLTTPACSPAANSAPTATAGWTHGCFTTVRESIRAAYDQNGGGKVDAASEKQRTAGRRP